MISAYNVAVIGGGPAGLMAAVSAAESGDPVVLIEKKTKLGIKLLMTGGTRCNLTNVEMTKQRLVELFGQNGKFLFSSFSSFGVQETLDFFNEHGLSTNEEDNGCVFTQSGLAQDVLYVFEKLLRERNVVVLRNSPVLELVKTGNIISEIRLAEQVIKADKVIVATGGLSYPTTGSTGDGFNWAEQLGHSLVEQRPALAPVYLQDTWISELSGVSLPDANVTLYHNGQKQKTYTGPMLFTEHGLSGPLIHGLSRSICDLLDTGPVVVGVDLLPEYTFEALDQKLSDDLRNNKLIRNFLETIVSSRLAEVILQRSGIYPETVCNTLLKQERRDLVGLLKNFTCQVDGVGDYDKAMLTAGGVALNEVDSKTMRSKLIENLYFAGEVLNLDGPSGGYNLQVCWTTGRAAGLG